MTLTTGKSAPRRSSDGQASGFTLIELILVMAMLLIAVSIVFPTLQGFFQGRVLEGEGRRLLALTRYGQNRAVSEGVPTVLWIDTRAGRYGLSTAAGYSYDDPRQRQFELDNDLTIEVSEPPLLSTALMAGMGTGSYAAQPQPLQPVTTTGVARSRDVATIEFLPDGYISLGSPESVMIKEGDKAALWLVQDTNRLGYAISAERPENRRR